MIIYCLMGLASVSMYLLAFFYQETSSLFGEEHSTFLLGFLFIVSIMGCTSSVLFIPYMRNYREIYIVSFMVGEGLSSLIPSFLAMIQGIGTGSSCNPEPRFSSKTYFLILGTLEFISFLSFICMNNLSLVKSERVKDPSKTDMKTVTSDQTNVDWDMSKKTYLLLWLMMGSICFLHNGLLLSIQPFSSLPYGHTAYRLTVILTAIAHPLAMAMKFIVKNPSTRLLEILMTLVLLLSSFVVFLAWQSPTPLWKDSVGGQVMMALCWTVLRGLTGFIQMGIIAVFRADPGNGLYFTGVVMQMGSVVGAIVSFVLVYMSGLFHLYDPCTAKE